jgi:hypothetical protein
MDQWRGNEVRSRRHNHPIERGVLGPAMIAVRNLELDVGSALPTESLLRLLPELFDNLDAVHLPSVCCCGGSACCESAPAGRKAGGCAPPRRCPRCPCPAKPLGSACGGQAPPAFGQRGWRLSAPAANKSPLMAVPILISLQHRSQSDRSAYF